MEIRFRSLVSKDVLMPLPLVRSLDRDRMVEISVRLGSREYACKSILVLITVASV